jgi:hypothetical protein
MHQLLQETMLDTVAVEVQQPGSTRQKYIESYDMQIMGLKIK